ncbi:GNAT family N-acetyltransferase [Geomicrobium sp. JSM 1781026]|uniref:GNAT family N-acetyltransferase n=1 Tax=Geomicrobium sp. JSM 1781026 TaxID=3344580 RepID=UPI0035C067B8
MNESFIHVNTEHLMLRMPQLDDVASVLAIEGHPEANQFRVKIPVTNEQEAQETLHTWRNNWHESGFGYWAVVESFTSEIIGFGGIRKENWQGSPILNLYYRFSPHVWGRGYAQEMAETALDLGKKHVPHIPVVARIQPVNKPSIRLAERLGLCHQPNLDSDHLMVFA